MAREKSKRQPEGRTEKEAKPLDLDIVDKAYGKFADLYADVLRVSVGATQEEIQVAYFDRRSELFTLLAKLDAKQQNDKTAQDRFKAERKMDCVVLAVRILGDSQTRHQYDLSRQERLLQRRKAQKELTPATSTKAVYSEPATKSTPRKRNSVKDEEDTLNQTLDTDYTTDDDTGTAGDTNTFFSDSRYDDTTFASRTIGSETLETYSVVSADINSKSGLFCLDSNRVFRNVVDEIQGGFEDTLTSMDQVFNAFTLTDKDIKAVTKRIDKAKKQLDT